MRLALFLIFGGIFCGGSFAYELPDPVKETDYRTYSPERVKLGQLLFYDRVLSGTFRISCATCHNPDRASSNGFALSPDKIQTKDDDAINGSAAYELIAPSAAHAPALFNLGAREFKKQFSDGRVEEVGNGIFVTPIGKKLPAGLSDVLAVQALFPVVEEAELLGRNSNDISSVAHLGEPAIWRAIAKRVQDLPDYLPWFQAAFPKVKQSKDISIVEIGNAIGAFAGTEWRSDNSPFDTYLRGDKAALNSRQIKGLELFYGTAKCSSCHSGKFQTDHQFYTTGLPVWRFDVEQETIAETKIRFGKEIVGKEEKNSFAYRTPSLRNVTKTGPFGHAGSYDTLESFLRDHINPQGAARSFLEKRSISSETYRAILNQLESDIAVDPLNLNDEELDALLEFLDALTEETVLGGKLGRPAEVPSALALD